MKLLYPIKLTTDINFYNSVFHFIVSTISKKNNSLRVTFLIWVIFMQKKKKINPHNHWINLCTIAMLQFMISRKIRIIHKICIKK